MHHQMTSKTIEELTEQRLIKNNLSQIRNLTGIPYKHFEFFYLKPLHSFLTLTQHCNQKEVNVHLQSVVRALKLRRSIILPFNSPPEEIHKKKDLWTYAVFICALVYKSSSLISRKVLFKDGLTETYLRWCPFCGAVKPGNKIVLVEPETTFGKSDIIFIPVIFDKYCISWLYQETETYTAVIDLCAAPSPNNQLGQLILTAHQEITIDEQGADNNDTKAVREPADSTSTVLTLPNTLETQPPEKSSIKHQCSSQTKATTQTGKQTTTDNPLSTHAIQTWLKKLIHNGEKPNLICRTLDGWAIADPDTFRAFSKLYNIEDWKALRHTLIDNKQLTQSEYQIPFGASNNKKNALILKSVDELLKPQ